MKAIPLKKLDPTLDKGNYAYSIKRIKDIYFYINESLVVPEKKEVLFETSQTLDFNAELGLANLTIRSYIHYSDTPKETDILAEIKVQNIFGVPDLNDFISEEALSFPKNLLIVMLSLSLSHTRSLFSKNIGSSVLQDQILPVFDVLVVGKAFYPDIFNDDNEQKALE